MQQETYPYRAHVRLKQWMEIFHDRAESGLSVKQYCQDKGIPQRSYFYWQRIARQSAAEGKGTFVELDVASLGRPGDSSSHFVPQLMISTDRFAIGFDSSIPQELLAVALEVARVPASRVSDVTCTRYAGK